MLVISDHISFLQFVGIESVISTVAMIDKTLIAFISCVVRRSLCLL